MLANGVQPVIFYYNPNIFPREEYEIRKQESKRHAESLGVRWIDGDYDHEAWREGVCGLESEPERGRRCEQCFFLRLKVAAEKAKELGIPYFTTTLASSRWKDIEQINRAGEKAERLVQSSKGKVHSSEGKVHSSKFRVQSSEFDHSTVNSQLSTLNSPTVKSPKFWAQNWRKGGLSDRRNQLLKEFGFYNQQYCGCEFSIRA